MNTSSPQVILFGSVFLFILYFLNYLLYKFVVTATIVHSIDFKDYLLVGRRLVTYLQQHIHFICFIPHVCLCLHLIRYRKLDFDIWSKKWINYKNICVCDQFLHYFARTQTSKQLICSFHYDFKLLLVK